MAILENNESLSSEHICKMYKLILPKKQRTISCHTVHPQNSVLQFYNANHTQCRNVCKKCINHLNKLAKIDVNLRVYKV